MYSIYSVVKYITILCCDILYSIVQYNTILYCTVYYNKIVHCNVLYTIVQYNTIPKQCAEEVSLSSDNPRGHCDSPSKGYQKTLLMTI